MRLLPELERAERARTKGFTRRQVLRWGLLGGAAALVPVTVPGCGDDGEPAAPPLDSEAPSFLTERERETLQALIETVLTPDEESGAVLYGVEDYIARLLSTIPTEQNPGFVFAGGPFSGRNPFPDYDRGAPSGNFPRNNFREFVPLNRWQRLSWRARLLGSDAVPEFDFNASVLGPVTGLRTQYRVGLQELEDLSQTTLGRPFTELTVAERQATLQRADADFVALVTGHILEGLFSAPEYGGNPNGLGWQLIGYDGDSQPLGYALFDRSADTYRERPDKPTSTANPNETFAAFPTEIATLLRTLTRLAGAPRFP
ncbi:MAG: gluconate 2-dehydrogenase subunit 3 family protein [Candidatus Binatia bacterium]|nr:gluconate 2-dehydrogenase subunit 3 family protein [Candidatus Binatia bacterium]